MLLTALLINRETVLQHPHTHPTICPRSTIICFLFLTLFHC